MEPAKIIRIELTKTKAGENAIKVQVCRDDETLSNKDRFANDFIRATSPEFVFKRWWDLLGYESPSWESFFSQDVFDLVGLRVNGEFESSEYGARVKKIYAGELALEAVGGNQTTTSTPPPPSRPPAPPKLQSSSVPEDDIPF